MLGSIANSVLGVPQPKRFDTVSETRAYFRPEPGQIAYGFTFDYSQELGRNTRVSVGYYATSEEAHSALADALIGIGYKPPKWWQAWRWRERLPANVLRTVSAQKQQAPTETNMNEQGT